MKSWTDEDILRLDARYAEEGVHPHQRPFHAAVELLGPGFSIGPPGFGSREAIDEIMAAYRRLLPEIDDAWPGAGIGIVASLDRVRKVILPVMLGGVGWIEVWRDLGFDSPRHWFDWCRGDPAIAAGSAFAYADLHDFCLGSDAIEGRKPEADVLWAMARSNLEDVANTLPAGFSMESVLQPICLIVELALKACLVWHDVNLKAEGFTGGKGHDLIALSRRLRDISPHRDDALVATYVTEMPAYVTSRYSPQGLTRLRVVKLVLAAQFIAASTLRRVSGEDLAAVMESTVDSPGQRPPLFPTS